jgi:O-antigen ligase
LPKIKYAGSDILFEQVAFGLFVATLAWSPFPLGSNRPWSWSLLALLIACVWCFWCCSIWRKPSAAIPLMYGYRAALILVLLAIAWGFIQVLPIVPRGWVGPVWQTTAPLVGGKLAATISVSPWRSTTELMKLVSYVMAAWLARVFARSPEGAYKLLDAIIIVGALYAAYSFVLLLIGHSQFEIFYGVPLRETAFSGPFVNRNSFATYEGLVAVCAGSRLITKTWSRAESAPDIGGRLLSTGHYLAGKGAIWSVAALLAFSAVVMTGSRAGNLATWSATIVVLFISLGLAKQQKRGWLALSVAVCVIAVAFALLAVNGAALAGRLDDMAAAGDTTRLLLWNAALKMIQNAPLTGWGLGTYQLVYPLYTTGSMHFVMDKAHNDILEFVAGFGLPAAVLWWSALAWLVAICGRGIFTRKRHRVLPAVALGASILVAIHSIFDFSLQMPAIALTYAAILGLGAAQAFPTSQNVERVET